ncbi:MAG: hypothetical protein JWM78_2097 [Verrucomicrobiaceae bacterium]|nr:hypothetical protein [Verrucomicrobiaceae bacterium]
MNTGSLKEASLKMNSSKVTHRVKLIALVLAASSLLSACVVEPIGYRPIYRGPHHYDHYERGHDDRC